METKSVLASKTNWGVILMLLPVLAKSAFGIDIDQALLSDSSNYIELLIQVIGGGLALYGRWKAKAPITWKLPDVPGFLRGLFKGPTLGLFLAVAMLLAGGNVLVACTTTAPASATDIAKRSAVVALSLYVNAYQPALIAYSKLPLCKPAKPPCLDPLLYSKLYVADGAAATCIAAVEPVLRKEFPDFVVVADCLDKVDAAKLIFAEAGLAPASR